MTGSRPVGIEGAARGSRSAGATRLDRGRPRWLAALSFRRRVALVAVLYLVASVGILGALLLQLRVDTLSAADKLMASLARLAADETSHALQSVDQTLTIAGTILSRRQRAGTLSQATAGEEFRALLRDRPYLRSMWLVDTDGRILYHSRDESLGFDLSDRAFYLHHIEHPGAHFHLNVPFKSRITGAWVLPATRSWLDAEGQLRGVLVAALDPRYFERAWSQSEWGEDVVIALFTRDATLLMRSPFDDQALGRKFAATPAMRGWMRGETSGSVLSTGPIDGVDRLVGFRSLAVDSSLFIVVGQGIRDILAPWRDIVGVVALGWMLATLGLAVLGTRLVREWEARQTSEARYRQLFEANPDPIAVVDLATRRYLAVNEAMVRQYGWSRQEFVQMTPADIRMPEDMHMLEGAIARARPGETQTIRGRHCRKDGSIIDVEVSIAPIEFDGRPALLPMARDVTARVAADREHRAAEEKLRQLQKMEAVGQLTGGVAHDFNNILMVMMANTDALEDDYELAAPVREHVENIARATRRAADLTRQLLAFSRKQPLKPKIIDINDLVVATGRLLRRTLGERTEMESVLVEGLWPVNVDPVQLETALVNLCVNSRDAMPSGGRLLIETANAVLDEAYAATQVDVVPGDYVMLAVTDTGQGIAPENLGKVFEPFFTTKEVGRGTGLGLSMVYGFVQQSRGHIAIESAPGRGTTVKLYLPRHAGPVERQAEVAHAVLRGRERILVVEDDALVRANVVGHLASLGYAVDQAADGVSGLAACAAATSPYDLVLTDVIMPGAVGGKELADEAARRWPALPVVFMSGYIEDSLIRDGRLAPGVRLLNKPFRRRELAEFVREALSAAGSTT